MNKFVIKSGSDKYFIKAEYFTNEDGIYKFFDKENKFVCALPIDSVIIKSNCLGNSDVYDIKQNIEYKLRHITEYSDDKDLIESGMIQAFNDILKYIEETFKDENNKI